MLTVIRRSGKHWICNCDCTNENVKAYTSDLTSGRKVDCGCVSTEKSNLVGKRFGRLTVVERDSKRKSDKKYWLCICDCDKDNNPISVYDGSLKSGDTRSCGCLQREDVHMRRFQDDREKRILNYLYVKSKSRQKSLGFDVSEMISLEEYTKMILQNCHYCGIESSNVCKDPEYYRSYNKKDENSLFNTEIKHNGLDRVDNDLGYSVDNVVTCCKYCNQAKMAMTVNEFLSWSKKVYNHFILGKKS